MKTELVVLADDPTAATQITVTGWVSREGQFWGNDERMARWCGSTHKRCEKHDSLYAKNSYCMACREEKQAEKWVAYPVEPWAGEPLFSEAFDKWFFGADELADHVADQDDPAAWLDGARLVFVEPQYAYEIDPVEQYQDLLPEDVDDVPADIHVAFDALNKVIRESKSVLSYKPKAVRAIVTLADLGITDTEGRKDD